jgi:hypothetical protein
MNDRFETHLFAGLKLPHPELANLKGNKAGMMTKLAELTTFCRRTLGKQLQDASRTATLCHWVFTDLRTPPPPHENHLLWDLKEPIGSIIEQIGFTVHAMDILDRWKWNPDGPMPDVQPIQPDIDPIIPDDVMALAKAFWAAECLKDHPNPEWKKEFLQYHKDEARKDHAITPATEQSNRDWYYHLALVKLATESDARDDWWKKYKWWVIGGGAAGLIILLTGVALS